MNIEKLSKRLETVVSYIKPNMKIADIGSDHAYLPCFAVKNGIASYAIAGEVVEGPYQSALNQVEAAQLTEKISVRKGNGLEVLRNEDQIDCIVIAGMGGSLITEILEAQKQKLASVSRLILQPNIAAEKVRKWLYEEKWQLVDEQLIEEEGKFYEILVAEPGNPTLPYIDLSKEFLLGPFLLKQRNDHFKQKWNAELKIWEKVLQELNKAEENQATEAKKQALLRKIEMVREELK
ncbi:tRNA (adenine(22)-N(1))-methyltransferase [Lederbergia galactosidilytica]|uniref:SAM-dependent methyltransferase n=1 Tax=Lederbergia galactosidilytica TaxID=217031 RepID=A0A178A3N4_9BACI|nr:tRNA (adenine(22)-N(1))-methyltransferase TrmK [Lederbergia galactosidilytica]MBP1914803.1 tRNA (adenine22-N1)-methyltransferase [Lederbergia galactosidilytica]OAK74701.1 SAM-dependent methyltransferase [Lederbergia galactosidilytica]